MSATKLPYGKPVKLLIDFQGFPDGRLVQFEIWRSKSGKENKVSEVYGVTKGGKGIGRWIPLIEREEILPLVEQISEPVEEEKYYFIAKIDDQEIKSGDMIFTYSLDIHVADTDDKPVDGVDYTITFLSDGSTREGIFKNGHAKVEDAPRGKFNIELENYEFVKPPGKILKGRWDTSEIKCGDKVKMIVEVKDFDDGTPAKFTVYEYEAVGKNYYLVKDGISGEVNGDQVEVEWQFEYDKNPDDVKEFEGFEKDCTFPEFIFDVEIEESLFRCYKRLTCYGGPLFVDEEGDPIEGMKALAYLPDGRVMPCNIRKGYLTEPYLWKRGKFQIHLVDDNIGGIE